MWRISRILVPIDFSECSRAALDYATYLSDAFDASVDVLHTYYIPAHLSPELTLHVASGPSKMLSEHLRQQVDEEMTSFLGQLARTPSRLSTRVELGQPADVILDVAAQQDYDLIVIGTHGRTGIKRVVLGSVAERVVRHAPCPVVVVHGEKAPGE